MTASIVVYQLDPHQFFSGETLAFESPLEPGVFLVPGGCVELAPPAAVDGMRARWVAGAWLLEPWVPPPQPTPAELLAAFLAANPAVMELVTPQA